VIFIFCQSSKYCYDELAQCHTNKNFLRLFWMEVPGRYYCSADADPNVSKQCSQHFYNHNGKLIGFVPCTISRPYVSTEFHLNTHEYSIKCCNNHHKRFDFLIFLFENVFRFVSV